MEAKGGDQRPGRVSKVRSVLTTAGKELAWGIRSLNPVEPAIPVEEFTSEMVGARIYHYQGIPTPGEPKGPVTFVPFTRVNVLASLGYPGVWKNEDVRQRHLEAHGAIGPILNRFVQDGTLTMEGGEPDRKGERVYYSVTEKGKARLEAYHETLIRQKVPTLRRKT